jgi:hypothetical protein
MAAEQKNSPRGSADEETQRAIRRMQAAGLQDEEARRAAALDLAIRRTMDWPR